MKILSPRSIINVEKYLLWMDLLHPELKGCGMSFECDKNGKLLNPTDEPKCAEYLKVTTWRMMGMQWGEVWNDEVGEYVSYPILCTGRWEEVPVSKPKVIDVSYSYVSPAIGECDCGHEVELWGFTNTCERCDRDYNSSGQLLADRSQWGEETGESPGDILRIR